MLLGLGFHSRAVCTVIYLDPGRAFRVWVGVGMTIFDFTSTIIYATPIIACCGCMILMFTLLVSARSMVAALVPNPCSSLKAMGLKSRKLHPFLHKDTETHNHWPSVYQRLRQHPSHPTLTPNQHFDSRLLPVSASAC